MGTFSCCNRQGTLTLYYCRNICSINFSEFLTVNMKKEKICNDDILHKAFKLFDLDGNGYITIDELKETILLEIQNNQQWIDIVKEVDQDGDCQISFDEFKIMMEKLSLL